jgi:hypothetical protein
MTILACFFDYLPLPGIVILRCMDLATAGCQIHAT